MAPSSRRTGALRAPAPDVRRPVVLVSVAALTVGLVPALAGPAQAAPANALAADPAVALSEVLAAAGRSRSSLLQRGGGQASATTFEVGSPVARSWTFRMGVVVDPVRRTARLVMRHPGLVATPDDSGDGPGLAPNPCSPDRLAYQEDGEIQVVEEGVGTHRAFGPDPGRYVNRGRKLVKRPRAAWELSRRAGASVAGFVASNDSAVALLAVLGTATTTAVAEETVPQGTRYDFTYTEPEVTGADGLGRLSATVDPSGALVSIAEVVDHGDGVTSRSSVAYSYAPQAVVAPTGAAVVERSRIVKGCRAVLTRTRTVDIARTVVKRLNRAARRSDAPVTQGKVRRAVRRALQEHVFALRIRSTRTRGGAVLTGRNRLLKKPVVLRVVVRDGSAVLRKGVGRAGAER